MVIQQKIGRPVQFEITADVRASQYARLVDEWVAAIGLRCEDYGTHSLRRG